MPREDGAFAQMSPDPHWLSAGVPSACKQVVSVEATRDIEWATYTCTLGFHVFGKFLRLPCGPTEDGSTQTISLAVRKPRSHQFCESAVLLREPRAHALRRPRKGRARRARAQVFAPSWCKTASWGGLRSACARVPRPMDAGACRQFAHRLLELLQY